MDGLTSGQWASRLIVDRERKHRANTFSQSDSLWVLELDDNGSSKAMALVKKDELLKELLEILKNE